MRQADTIAKAMREQNRDSASKPQRYFMLQRFQDLAEVPILKKSGDAGKVLAHYAGLIANRVSRNVIMNTVDFQPTEIGPLLATFDDGFPAHELPFNGGLEHFSFDGYEHRFDAFGANTVRTLFDADLLHRQALCKPLMCSNPTCFNYTAAVDEYMFVPPLAVFARVCPDTAEDVPMDMVEIRNGECMYDVGSAAEITPSTAPVARVAKAHPVLLDEYVFELEPEPLPFLCRDVILHGLRWELFPIPSDASRLDMHLAHISSLDTRYAQRFTREVRYMDEFKDPHPKPSSAHSHDEDDAAQELLLESDSDTESYVESALIPGLRHRDFSKPISTTTVLSGLTLDESTRARVLEALQS